MAQTNKIEGRKMSFKSVLTNQGQANYVSYKTAAVGTILAEGTYMGMTRNTKFTKPGELGKPTYTVKNSDGSLTVLNSAGHLDKNLPERVQVGDYVQIILRSKSPATKGPFAGKESYLFDINVDADRHDSSAQG